MIVARRLASALFLAGAFILPAAETAAQAGEQLVFPTLAGQRVAKAQPDACFTGIGEDPADTQPPCDDGQGKVNQAYVWGLALAGDKAFFGTVANTHCLVLGSYLQSTTPVENADYVCEFGDSPLVRNGVPGVLPAGALPAAIGDFRPPQLFVHDGATGVQTDLGAALPPPAAALLASTLGIRAAGTLDGVVLFAGPALDPSSGINVFAFSAADGTFLGAQQLPGYSNIRKFIVADGELYAGVGTYDATDSGRILRWTGDSTSPFTFDEVGIVASSVAELASHDGRLFVTTWPDGVTPGAAVAGLYMSPELPVNGLPAVSAGDTSWQQVWSVSDYEADPITAATYGGGALASYGGYLFWGTMHVPGLSSLAHGAACEQVGSACTDNSDGTELFLNSERAISVFRGSDFGSVPRVELLYGYATMPVFNAADGSWSTQDNLLGEGPVFGTAGFNNPLNNYTWTMQVFDDRLWVGTMDWSRLLAGLGGIGELPTSGSALVDALLQGALDQVVGADLWYFPSAEGPALPEALDGVGNTANYGIRTMAASGDQLYLGTANPMNLRTDPAAGDLGGWELIALQARPENTPAGSDVTVDLGDGSSVRFCDVDSSGNTRLISVAGIAGLNDFSDRAVPGLPEDLPSLPSGERVQDVLLLASTADWREIACEPQATLSLKLDRSYYNPRILQVTVNPEDGSLGLEDITGQRYFNGAAAFRLTNAVDAGLTGTFGGWLLLLEGPAPVPALPAAALAALGALLALAGGAGWRRRRRD